MNDRRALAVIVTAFFTGYTLYGLVRHWHFGSSAFDLGIFDQAVWHLSRFEAPASTINGFNNVFGDHFFPIIALWAPLYWIAPAAETLVLSQALLFAASIVPVFLFLRDRLSRRLALALSIAYGLFWGVQRAMAFDVHEFAFAPLVIATAILAVDRQRWRLFWVCMGGLLLIKEDLIPLIGGFGLLLLIRGQPRHGYFAIGGSILAFAAVIGWVIPSFNSAGAFPYAGAFQAVLEQPSSIPLSLVTPIEKVRTILLWLGPFVFTSVLSPFAVLIPPIAVERLLSSSPNHWGGAFHYSAPLAPIIAMSAGDGLARLQRALTVSRGAPASRMVATAIAYGSIVLCAVLPGRQPLWRVLAWDHYVAPSTHATGRAALGMVPDGASVVAQAAIVPHLSQRPRIFVLDGNPPDADYVVMAKHLSPWPLVDIAELTTVAHNRFGSGYSAVFERDGWTVLKRRSNVPQ